MMIKFFIVLSMIFCSQSFAKGVVNKKNSRKPNQVEATFLSFKVVYGEKTTYFTVAKSKTGGKVDYTDNFGSKDSKNISADDFDFIKAKISRLKAPSNKKSYCTRSYIEVSDGTRTILGCMGSSNKIAKEIQQTVNILSSLF